MELTYFCPNYIHTDVILKATIQQLSTMWSYSQLSSSNAWEKMLHFNGWHQYAVLYNKSAGKDKGNTSLTIFNSNV